MPQVKTKSRTEAHKDVLKRSNLLERPTLASAGDLINRLYSYEETAIAQGIDFTSGRFKKLTASEQQFLRAELVADYIRLSAGNSGNTPFYFEDALQNFCTKICEMSIPSHELIGTYLAALSVVSEDKRLKDVTWLEDTVRRTMVCVLGGCVEQLKVKTQSA